MNKLLLPLLISATLTACGGDSSTTTTTNSTINNTATNKPSSSVLGYWEGATVIRGTTYASGTSTFIGESGMTVLVLNDTAVVYGDLNYSGTTGTGTLTEIDGKTYTYASTVSIATSATKTILNISATDGTNTASFTGEAGTANNAEYKKKRTLADLNGTWYQYYNGGSDTFTMTNGIASFRSLALNCLINVTLKDEGYQYSEFSMLTTATECNDTSLNGTYNAGLAVSGAENSVETITMFAFKDDAWIGGDFYRK